MIDYTLADETYYTIGEAIIDSSFHTQRADEEFFRYFGNNVIYSIQRTIHEDDFEKLRMTLASLNTGECKKITIRMKGINAEYRHMLVTVRQCTETSNSINYCLNISDVLSLEELFYNREYKIAEYRHILSMTGNLSFEYNFETRHIKVFMLDCFREITIVDEDLDSWQTKAIIQKLVQSSSLSAFNGLCNDIKSGVYKFEYEIESALFTNGKNNELNIFKGITRCDDLEHKKIIGIISASSSKYKSKNINLAVETNRDSLSELLNKRTITEYAMSAISGNPPYNVNIVLLDIDNFTQINNTYGHLFGDEVIFTIASIIKSSLGERGIAGRLNGSGFLLIVEGTQNETDLRGILRAIRTKIEWAFADRFDDFLPTCSMGVSTYPVDSNNYDELFMQADKALFLAQEKGKNRYVIYDINKHGPVEKDLNNKIAYIGHKKVGTDRISFIGSITDKLISDKPIEPLQLLDEIRIHFGLDSAYIFEGEEMETALHCGNGEPLTAAYIFNPQYNEKFNGDGILAVDNVNELEGRADEAFEILSNQNIMGTFQYLITEEDKIKGLISFNYIGRFKKWSVTDINHLTILSRIVSSVFSL